MLKPEKAKEIKEEKVAVIGAGPVGTSCAYHLLQRGYPVDIFEAKEHAGGMIRYGIPIYRLPKDTLQAENNIVSQMGGKFIFNQKLGRDFDINDLFGKGYKAIFIACGAPLGSYLGMKDEDTSLAGYMNGIDFLENVYNGVEAGHPPVLDGDVVVVGGGNVAMDCLQGGLPRCNTANISIIAVQKRDAPDRSEEFVSAKAERAWNSFSLRRIVLLLKTVQNLPACALWTWNVPNRTQRT